MQSSIYTHTLRTVPIAIPISICASTYTNLNQHYKCENKATLQSKKYNKTKILSMLLNRKFNKKNPKKAPHSSCLIIKLQQLLVLIKINHDGC